MDDLQEQLTVACKAGLHQHVLKLIDVLMMAPDLDEGLVRFERGLRKVVQAQKMLPQVIADVAQEA